MPRLYTKPWIRQKNEDILGSKHHPFRFNQDRSRFNRHPFHFNRERCCFNRSWPHFNRQQCCFNRSPHRFNLERFGLKQHPLHFNWKWWCLKQDGCGLKQHLRTFIIFDPSFFQFREYLSEKNFLLIVLLPITFYICRKNLRRLNRPKTKSNYTSAEAD